MYNFSFNNDVLKGADELTTTLYLFIIQNKNYNNDCLLNISLLLQVLKLTRRTDNKEKVKVSLKKLQSTNSIKIDKELNTIDYDDLIKISLELEHKSFTPIPIAMFELTESIGRGLINLFMYLFSYENKTYGYAFPKQEDIERDLGITNKTIQAYKERLKSVGLIDYSNSVYNPTTKRRENTKYYINHGKLSELIGEDLKQEDKVIKVDFNKTDSKIKNNSSVNVKVENTITDELKSKIAEIIGVKVDEFKLYKGQLEKIEAAGQDSFISILKNNIPKYTSVLYGSDFQNNIQYMVSTILKNVFENDLPRELAEIKRRGQEFYKKLDKAYFSSKEEEDYFLKDMNGEI